MKVLLVSANTLTEPYPVYPMGLDYVAAAVADRHRVRVVDMNALKGGLEELKKVITQEAPDAIGISLRNVDNTDITDPRGFAAEYGELVDAVREASLAPVILGGSGFTIFPQEFMAVLEADYGVIGEGERLAELLEALSTGADPEGIPGIVVRGKTSRGPAPLDKAFPRGFRSESQYLDYYLKRGAMLNLQTKRGCPFRCIYCTYPHVEGRRLRLIPPLEIAETAAELQEAGARYLFVTDSAFNCDIAHSMEVARAFQTVGVSIPWGGFFAPIHLPAEYFRTMAAAGLTHVEFGTESLSDSVLSAYRKPFRTAQVFAAHRAALDAGLHVAHYLLFGGPGENRDTMTETFSNVDKLNRTVLFLFCGMRIYPHTALYDLALKDGMISRSTSLLAPLFYSGGSISNAEILQEVEAKSRGKSNWVIGAGGEETARVLAKMYRRGFSGPLWEYLIQ